MTTTWEKLSSEFTDAVQSVGPSVVAVDGRAGHTCSGLVWKPDVVVTAGHGVRVDSGIRVITASHRPVGARIAGRDRGTDLAVLRLDAELDAPRVEFAKTDGLSVGDLVLAVARTRRGNLVASAGIISGLMGEWRMARTRIDQFIRPDVRLHLGFSGGALVGAGGMVLGMNTRGMLRRKPITMPGSTLDRVAGEILARGHVEQPYIGLVMHPVPVPESIRERSGVASETGLLVMHVESDGPADTAGALLGDLLVAADQQPFEDRGELQTVLDGKGVGQEVEITAIRGGQAIGLTVRIGTRPLR